MSKIEDFLKVQCGDPAKGTFEAPASFEDLARLFHDFISMEYKPLTKEIIELAEGSAEARVLFNYVNLRRLTRCSILPMPSSEARIATGLRSGPNAHLLALLERYMDEHPEEFGTIKIENG